MNLPLGKSLPKYLFTSALLMSMGGMTTSAKDTWVDVTDTYVINPRFDNNDRTTGWEGTKYGAANPRDNAEHYSKNFDSYQTLKGLAPGKYRLSLNAFYRIGSASNDYSVYKSGNYEASENAKLYATSSVNQYEVGILPASSAALTQSLGGGTARVGDNLNPGGWPGGGNWGGNSSTYYIPNDMEAANYWFNAGYYNNVLECEVGEDGVLTIGIKKEKLVDGDWTCLDNWKLEYLTDAISSSEVTSENLVINEIMASNIDVYLDPSFNYGSWVELYNPSDKSVNLGGLYISDDPANLKKHRLVDTYGILPAHGYALLNFDHHDIYTKAAIRQIDDDLDYEGGTIVISDGEQVIAQQTYPQAISRTSYARTTDGGDTWGVTGNPSPGKSNQASAGFATSQLEAPVVDQSGKVFSGSLDLNVTIPEGATLRYTTDGTTPTLKNGEVSTTGKFTVDKTTCYRFRLFQDGFLPSQVVTRSFILDNGNYPFPIISVVTDDNNIHSKTYGVFEASPNGRPGRGSTTATNWNMEWDRPVSFEYISEDNQCLVSQECNFAMCGGWSRAWTPHSFKLKANKVFDANNFFKAPLFENKPYIKNKTLQIRNGGNDTGCRIKDAALQRVVAKSGLRVDYQEWKPVHVFLNGEHYAVLNMREPNNKHFAYSNYGIDSETIDQFEMSPDSGYVQMAGTPESFTRLVTLSEKASDEATYQEIGKLLDIDEYANYMAVELFLGGNDWPQNNVKGFRDTNEGKFHFVLFDLDAAGGTSTPFDNFFGKERYTFDVLHGYDYSKNESLEQKRRTLDIKFVTLFKNLLQNETFRKKFIDTYCVVAGSVFQPKYVESIVSDAAEKLAQGGYVDPTSSANWLKSKFGNESYNGNIVNQLKNCSYMQLGSTERQHVSVSTNVESAKVELNGIELPYNELNGYIFSPATLKAVAPAGYKFAGWKGTSSSSESTSGEPSFVSEDAEYTLPANGAQAVCAVFEKMTDEELEAKPIAPVRVNEISADNSMYINDYFKKNDWIELYNTTDEAVDIAGMYISDNKKKPKKYQVPTDNVALNTVIPAHGYKVVWCDKLAPVGEDIHTSFKLDADGGEVLITTKAFADTLTYEAHVGTQSFGRYPDGSDHVYLMNAPTIGKTNCLSSYDVRYGEPDQPETPTHIASTSTGDGLTVAYVDGVVNVRSTDACIQSVELFNMAGMKVNGKLMMRQEGHFVSIPVAHLSQGVYVLRATTEDGKGRTVKLQIK